VRKKPSINEPTQGVFEHPDCAFVEQTGRMMVPPEPFAETRRAAAFAAIKPARLLEMVRAGKVRAYPVGLGSERHQWVFRLSELAEDITSLRNACQGNISRAALVSQRRQSNG
jgi:hypothetical protein